VISLLLSHLVLHFGLPTCLNLYGSVLFSHSHTTGLGASKELCYRWNFEGTCVVCLRPLRRMWDIFCGNFLSSWEGWAPCHSLWHAECYTCHGQMPIFPTSTIKDKLGNAWHKEAKHQRRLTQGVEGAHLCISFQCGSNWRQGQDLACIKHANLDVLAGKSPLTIVAHLRETTTMIKHAALVNKTPSYQPRGPFPLADSVEMGLAVDMLIKSLVSKD
jgi:hypothetical protein